MVVENRTRGFATGDEYQKPPIATRSLQDRYKIAQNRRRADPSAAILGDGLLGRE
jgi:hypothetical protein